MVHIGDTAISMEEIVDTLRPGDVVTHCFTPLKHISKIIDHPDNSNVIWVAAQGPLVPKVSLVGSMAMFAIRPDVKAGPIFLSLRAL